MPINPNATVMRFSEVASTACAEQTLRQLHELACAPSGKVYARQREARLALWKQLLEVAEVQVAALSVAPVAKRRAAKPTVMQACPTPVAEAAVKE